jgi:hypothetical protein
MGKKSIEHCYTWHVLSTAKSSLAGAAHDEKHLMLWLTDSCDSRRLPTPKQQPMVPQALHLTPPLAGGS